MIGVMDEFASGFDDKRVWKLRQNNPEKVMKVNESEVRAIYPVVGLLIRKKIRW